MGGWGPECFFVVEGGGNLILQPVTQLEVLTNSLLVNQFRPEVLSDLVWHKQVPLKVSILAWRLLQNRHLYVRGVLPLANQHCVVGCGDIDTTQHLFLSCPFYATLWGEIRSWLGVPAAEPLCVSDHFYQFVYSAGGSRTIRSFMQLIWLCCVWVLWNERTSRVFKNMEHTVHQLVEKVKLHSF